MKVEEGYVKCSTCKGTGKDGDYICQKCQGEGVTDWITNAMFRVKPLSALDSINVRRMLLYVRKTIENYLKDHLFEPSNIPIEPIKSHLDYCKSNRILYDYKISDYITPSNERQINITIKPTKTVEMIQLKFEVNRSG